MEDAQFLTAVFDFDLGEDAEKEIESVAVRDDKHFVERMAAEIDALWSEFAVDINAVSFAQKQFEAELDRRESEQSETARRWVQDSEERQREEEWVMAADAAEDTMTGDRMIFSNFVASNKLNDFTEDDTVHCINYLHTDSIHAIAE